MAYTKQEFKSGDKLYAAQLNAMDEQIATNEEATLRLSEEIGDLDMTVKEVLTGEFNIADYAGFVSATGTWNGKPTGTETGGKRVVSNNIMTFDSDVVISAKNGFLVGTLNFADDGTYDTTKDIQASAGPYTIPAGMNFRLQIRRTSEVDGEIADASYFASQLTTKKDSELSNIKKRTEQVAANFNIFSLPIYHHMNQEDARYCNIPAESLADIHYAKKLGFNLIEANAHLCADGVYVCKHGSSGYLGYGLTAADGSDPMTIEFSAVTSTWIRENIRYNSSLDKYKGVIPTLDEFCAECRKLNMMVKFHGYEAVDVARNYLPDDMIWITASERKDFRGTIEYVWYTSKDIDATIATCQKIGSPLNIVIHAGEFDGLSDDKVREMCAKAHAAGFTVGVTYPNSTSLLRAFSLGVDVAGATSTNVNHLPYGNEKNIGSLDSDELMLTNATYDSTADTITVANGGSIAVNGDAFRAGIASLRIRYNGTLTIYNHEKKNHLEAYVSDGSNVVELSTVIQPLGVDTYTRWLTIEANADTVIYDFELHCSRI